MTVRHSMVQWLQIWIWNSGDVYSAVHMSIGRLGSPLAWMCLAKVAAGAVAMVYMMSHGDCMALMLSQLTQRVHLMPRRPPCVTGNDRIIVIVNDIRVTPVIRNCRGLIRIWLRTSSSMYLHLTMAADMKWQITGPLLSPCPFCSALPHLRLGKR